MEGNFSPEHSVYSQTLTCDGEAGVVAERMRLWLKRGCAQPQRQAEEDGSEMSCNHHHNELRGNLSLH